MAEEKEVKDSKQSLNIPVISIVAIVGVVAIVLLLSNSNSPNKISATDNQAPTENLAGQASPILTLCKDSDGGKNYNVKGTTCLGRTCKTDVCTPSYPNLLEFYCQTKYKIGSVTYSCPYGCNDGACSSSSSTTFAVIEDDGSLSWTDDSGNRFLKNEEVAKTFYKNHRDSYDFLGIYSDFPTIYDGSSLVSNDVGGVGLATVNYTNLYGSTGKLKTISKLYLLPFSADIDENGLKSVLWQDFFLLAHEIGHHWCCHINSNPQIAGQGGHWLVSFGHSFDQSMLKNQLDTDGLDIMGGADFIDNKDGTFTMRDYSAINARVSNFFPFTRYLMGFLAPEEVPDTIMLTFPSPVNTIAFTSTAQKNTIGLSDIVTTNGVRTPAYPNAQKDFSTALILVVDKGKQPTEQVKMRMQNLVDNFPWYWTRATHCASTMSTNLAGSNAVKCQPISLDRTTAIASPSSLPADGVSQSQIIISVFDASRNPLSNRVVEIFPDNIDKTLIYAQIDAIRPPGFTYGNSFGGNMFAVTDEDGKTIFTTTSKVATTFSYFIIVDGSYLPVKPVITFY